MNKQQEEQLRPPLSQDELMKKLVGAKKVMSMVDGGNYKEGNINSANFTMPDVPTGMPDGYTPEPQQMGNPALNEDRIRNSKLPDAIKEAMIKNPIQQSSIDATEHLDMKIFENARRLMNEDSGKNIKKQSPSRQYSSTPAASINSDDLISKLTPIIENAIRKIMDEKLTQILTAQETGTINENLAIKVGDSIFSGKITKVKNSK